MRVNYSNREPQRPRRLTDAEIVMLPMAIVIDTREQLGWDFRHITQTAKKREQIVVPRLVSHALATGDYSLAGQETQIVIERKSASDAVGSVSGGRQRFEREHERMRDIVQSGGMAFVFVESLLVDVCQELNLRGGKFTAASFAKTVFSWTVKYRVPWLFYNDRRTAEVAAFWHLYYHWKHCTDEGRAHHA